MNCSTLCQEADPSFVLRHIRPGIVTSLTYHGHGREEYDATIKKYHIVLTTYSTVMVEKKRHNFLFSHNWYRIVLDEGLPYPASGFTPNAILT